MEISHAVFLVWMAHNVEVITTATTTIKCLETPLDSLKAEFSVCEDIASQ